MEEEKKENQGKRSPVILIIIIAVLAIIVSTVLTVFIMKKISKDTEDKSNGNEDLRVEESIEETDNISEKSEESEKKEDLEGVTNDHILTYVENIDVSKKYIHPVTGKKLSKIEENRLNDGFLLEENISNRVFLFLDDFVIENIVEFEPGRLRLNVSKLDNRIGEDILSLPVVFDFDYYSIMDKIEDGKTIELDRLYLEITKLEEIGRTGYLVKYK